MNYQKFSKNMNVDYSKILWMPIDLPKFPIKDFYLNPTGDWTAWNFEKLTEHTDHKYDISKIRTDVADTYPELINWINLFPFRDICNIKFNVQKNHVPPHIDFASPEEGNTLFINNSQNEPCGYRVVVSGKRQNNIYIMTTRGKEYVTLPDSTDVYVLGQTNCLHGVDNESGRKTMYLQLYIDPKKHQEILERSYIKYKDFVIFD